MLDFYTEGISVSQAGKLDEGKEVTLKGWLHRKRSSGGKVFVILRDRTGIIQCVAAKGEIPDEQLEVLDAAYLESSAIVRGTIKKDPRAPGGVELKLKETVIENSKEQYPITEYQSPELLLDLRHLWLRSLRMSRIMRIRSSVFSYAREFLDKGGFCEITPPLLTKAGGETGANLFEVDYFGQKVYLTESSQLYAEAMIYSLEKVYSFAPSYRAEKSRTVKHLAEYWHLEPEMAYYNNEMSMQLQERLVSHIANSLARDYEDILPEFGVGRDWLMSIKPPFKRLSYEEALGVLNGKGAKKVWGDDFGVEDERMLTEDEEKPIFICNWPKEIKAFYMPVNPKDPRTVLCSDMQAPKGHGEIIGGSERIWKLEELSERMDELKLNKDNYAWYLDLRRYGSVPHAGFGMGMERVIKWLLNLDHIRDAIPFPRLINRATP
jgi:asparaginyl-tRNA synthetase